MRHCQQCRRVIPDTSSAWKLKDGGLACNDCVAKVAK